MKKQKFIPQNVNLSSKQLVCIFLIFIFIIFLLSLRTINYPPGEDSYLTLKLVNEFLKNPSLIIKDTLSFSSRLNPFFSLTETLIALISLATKLQPFIVAKVFSYLFSTLTLILFILILKELKVNNKITFLSTLIFLFSPAFIYLISTTSQYFMSLFLTTLIFYLFLKSYYKLFSFFLFLFPFINPLAALITILFTTILIIIKNKKFLYLLLPPYLTLIFYLAYLIYLLKFSTYFNILQNINPLSLIISDFGFQPGLSIFLLISAVYGLIPLWKKVHHSKTLYLFVTILFILSFFSKFALILLAPFASILASNGLLNLHYKKWASNGLKAVTVAALMFGIFLSSFTFVFNHPTQLPNKEVIGALAYLKINSPENSIILSDPSRGHWINYFAERKNIADSNTFLAPEAKERLNDIDRLFKTRDISKFNEISKKYKINYIFIDSDLKKQLWKTDEEGLQFIIKNNPDIVKFYKNNNAEIWRIVS